MAAIKNNKKITLIGKKKELITILESHIAYLRASGYDNSTKYYTHPELNMCYNFLIQLDEGNELLKEVKRVNN